MAAGGQPVPPGPGPGLPSPPGLPRSMLWVPPVLAVLVLAVASEWGGRLLTLRVAVLSLFGAALALALSDLGPASRNGRRAAVSVPFLVVVALLSASTLEVVERAVEPTGRSRSRGEPLVLRQSDVKERDLVSTVLDGRVLDSLALRGLDLSGLQAVGASLRRTDLRGADLSAAHLQGADLRGADLTAADLRRADMRGADLRAAVLRGANLRGACLAGSRLEDAELVGADFSGAGLAGTTVTAAARRLVIGWPATVARPASKDCD